LFQKLPIPCSQIKYYQFGNELAEVICRFVVEIQNNLQIEIIRTNYSSSVILGDETKPYSTFTPSNSPP